MQSREELMQRLKKQTQVLQSDAIERAFQEIDRADFVKDDYTIEAYEDYPLPIGYEQTISQPTTVAFMLEKLDPQKGERVLDVGSGSGWTTALLAHMVGSDGRVIGVERIPELVKFSRENLGKYDFSHAEIRQASDELGAPNDAPFDKILVSAAADDLPHALLTQLKKGGIMVVPVRDVIAVVRKKGKADVETERFPGFAFVPLVENDKK